jgi:hypothetical protein
MGVAAGRAVFTHRLNADESTHDVLTVTPDLSSITALCEHTRYQRLADGSTARVVLAGYDDELLDERNIPGQVIGPARGASGWPRLSTRTNRYTSTRSGARASRIPHCSPTRCRR